MDPILEPEPEVVHISQEPPKILHTNPNDSIPQGCLFRVCLPILGAEFMALKRCRLHLHDDVRLVTKWICSVASMFFLNAFTWNSFSLHSSNHARDIDRTEIEHPEQKS